MRAFLRLVLVLVLVLGLPRASRLAPRAFLGLSLAPRPPSRLAPRASRLLGRSLGLRLKHPIGKFYDPRPCGSRVRSAFLDDAEPEAISHAVRDVLERRGALISEHRHSRVRFHGLKPRAMSWPRAGYVGIYQPLGEREAEVRLLLRARTPWRLLLTVCVVNVLLLVLAFATNPPPTAWTLLAIFGGLALLAAALLYVGTLKSVREEERAIMAEFEQAFGQIPDVDIETDEERELRELEAELEGEVTRRRIAAARPPREKGRRFSLRPGRKAAPEDEESPEARRERLLARKAELEARLRERDAAQPREEERPQP